MHRASLEALVSRLRDARRIAILTGAGISAASGVPTFRGADGLWRRYRPEDLATPEAFARDPHLVWEWYAWRREKIAGCQPNAGHHVLARWSKWGQVKWGQTPVQPDSGVRPRYNPTQGSDPGTGRLKVSVITQNVDDLHVQAGTRDLVKLHGSIWELSCAAQCARGSQPWRDDRVPIPELPPKCPHCGALARPAVVWFGESLRPADVEAAVAAASSCDVFLTVGTSAVVYPAAGLVHHARARGAFTAEINLEPTPASSLVDVAIQGGAEEILPALDDTAWRV